jgi:hypothetical protein
MGDGRWRRKPTLKRVRGLRPILSVVLEGSGIHETIATLKLNSDAASDLITEVRVRRKSAVVVSGDDEVDDTQSTIAETTERVKNERDKDSSIGSSGRSILARFVFLTGEDRMFRGEVGLRIRATYGDIKENGADMGVHGDVWLCAITITITSSWSAVNGDTSPPGVSNDLIDDELMTHVHTSLPVLHT